MEAGEGSSAVEQAVSGAEVALDRTLLKLFNAAVRGDRLQQALEAACQLSQVKSLEGAIKLANHNRQTALADRIAMFLKTRLELEAAEEADQVSFTLHSEGLVHLHQSQMLSGLLCHASGGHCTTHMHHSPAMTCTIHVHHHMKHAVMDRSSSTAAASTSMLVSLCVCHLAALCSHEAFVHVCLINQSLLNPDASFRHFDC